MSIAGSSKSVANSITGTTISTKQKRMLGLIGVIAVKFSAFIALTKPRIIEQLLITTVPTMIVAERGWPGLWLILATIIGGTLSAGGANAVNMWWDRDIDALMKRTSKRPLVKGVISPKAALVFALGLQVVAFIWLSLFVNLLSAVLALSAAAFYVFIYTMWLKRSSPSNIVIGGAAGAVPVLIGWSSVTNQLSFVSLILFGMIFIWTPPHFWALAFKYRDDYKNADVPMLPVVSSLDYTAKQIFIYSVILLILSAVFGFMSQMGFIYWSVATVSGAVFIGYAIRLLGNKDVKTAMRLFHWSITYLTLVFIAMAIDQLI